MSKIEACERTYKRDWSNRSLSRTGQMSWGDWFAMRRDARKGDAA